MCLAIPREFLSHYIPLVTPPATCSWGLPFSYHIFKIYKNYCPEKFPGGKGAVCTHKKSPHNAGFKFFKYYAFKMRLLSTLQLSEKLF